MARDTKDLIDAIQRPIAEYFHTIMEDQAQKLTFRAPGASPLEQVVGSGLHAWVFFYNGFGLFEAGKSTSKFYPEMGVKFADIKSAEHEFSISIWHQPRVGNYTADFIVRYANYGKVIWAAIECDGHDFHERTKEQAAHDRARDRHFQEAGLFVLRFTGSEIWRDPSGVFWQIHDFMFNKARGDG